MEKNWTIVETKAAFLKRNHPEWRLGQSYFNALYEYDPQTADQIRGTKYDCFHSDELISQFTERVLELWSQN